MDVIWQNLLQPGIPILEKILRPIIVYVFLIVGLRLAGKRELAQLNPFDLVVLLTISNTVQNAIIGNDNSVTGGLLGATTLLVVNWMVVRWTFHHPRVERLIEGTPTVLMDAGQIDEAALAREFVTRDEFASAARRQGYLSLDDVERAVLEPGGSLTFAPKDETTRVRRHDQIMTKLAALEAGVAALRRRADGPRRRSAPSAEPPGVERDDALDRPPADPAEPDRVAREHDAVRLGPVEPLRLVGRAFERADFPRMRHRREELRFPLELRREQRVHLRLGGAASRAAAGVRPGRRPSASRTPPCPTASAAASPARPGPSTSARPGRAAR